MTTDLTQAELDIIHAVIDARDLTEEEHEQLEREAGDGGGPLTESILAEIERSLRREIE